MTRVSRFLTGYGFYGVAALAGAVLVRGLQVDPTAVGLEGDPGVYAALLALMTATMIMLESEGTWSISRVRIPRLCLGLGATGSAYLWIADEANIAPLDPELTIGLSLLVVLAVFFAFFIALAATSLTPKASGKEENGDSGG